MIWVYGICDRPDLPPGGRGLDGAPLEAVREGPLVAVISRHEERLGDPTPEAMWAHEHVTEQLMAERTVLPMRFASLVEDDTSLRELLRDREDDFAAALERVQGRVEIGVRVADVTGGEASPGAGAASGREYLRARMRESRRADDLYEPLAALAVDARRRLSRGGDEILRAAYLVDRPVVPRFRAEVERLQRRRTDVAILCTGPWPPYSFVDLPRADRAPAPQ